MFLESYLKGVSWETPIPPIPKALNNSLAACTVSCPKLPSSIACFARSSHLETRLGSGWSTCSSSSLTFSRLRMVSSRSGWEGSFASFSKTSVSRSICSFRSLYVTAIRIDVNQQQIWPGNSVEFWPCKNRVKSSCTSRLHEMFDGHYWALKLVKIRYWLTI